MAIPSDFIQSLKYIHPKDVAEAFVKDTRPTGGRIWAAGNEVPPIDVFCYLGARFGQPNGIQNMLRADSSDNLIHWEWVLQCEWGWVVFQGMNYRTEIHLMGNCTTVRLLNFPEQKKLSAKKGILEKRAGTT